MVQTIYVNGQWQAAQNGKTWPLINPATEEVIQEVSFGDGQDATLAIEAAQVAFKPWEEKGAYARAKVLHKAASIIRQHLKVFAERTVMETGKPFPEAKGEWHVAADFFEWFAEEAKRNYGRTIPSRRGNKRMWVISQPIGVVGIITAWNFPAYNPARAMAAALAAGCTVVLKASEYTPLTAIDMIWALQEAGIPDGVVNLINGDAPSIGERMLQHPSCRKISFTGSTRVGKILLDGASATHTRFSLELGGNAPILVFADSDYEKIAKAAAIGRNRNCGQVCIAPQRVIVQQEIYEAFSEQVAQHVSQLRLGMGMEAGTQVGPLINAAQRERVEAMVEDAKALGAKVLAGGKRPEAFPKGYFYEPTVLNHLNPEMRVLKEEIFGPIMPIIPFQTQEEAIRLANQTEYGLAAYLWTRDINTAVHCAEQLEFGMIGINEWAPHATEAPFPGWKQSGLGQESGKEGLEGYLEKKLISLGSL